MSDMVPTRIRLAAALDRAGLLGLGIRARAGAYDELHSESAMPIVDLVNDLRAVGANHLAERAVGGEWNATPAEIDAWQAAQDSHGVR
jgi:hypothetical protein